jgi:predicted ATPase
VAQLIREGGIDIPPCITFLVGENGSGKSTLLEAIAEIYPREGHRTNHAAVVGPGPSLEDSPLFEHLRPRLHRRASPAGFFLRAEAMHDFLSGVDSRPEEARAWRGEKSSNGGHSSQSPSATSGIYSTRKRRVRMMTLGASGS